MDRLKGRVAVVTGGTRGLGLAIARAFAAEGASVAVGSRSESAVRDAVAELRSAGAPAAGRPCDVSDLDEVEALAAHAESSLGPMDVWVNNAGLAGAYGPTMHLAPSEFARVTQTNVLGTYYGSRVAMVRFLNRREGKLINLTGRGDRSPTPMQNAYGASKAWIRSFTLALAKEYEDTGVGVFAFSPGLVVTDMLRRVRAVEGFAGNVETLRTVVRLWGNPPEVPARRAVWLASAATDGRTGLDVHVLTRAAAMGGVVREAARRLLRRPAEPFDLQITTVAPALEQSGRGAAEESTPALTRPET